MEMNNLYKKYIQARRELIARDFSGLNEKQLEAVLSTEGPLLLLAGAGSGKTTVLISRIANLIRYGRASDSEDVPEDIRPEDWYAEAVSWAYDNGVVQGISDTEFAPQSRVTREQAATMMIQYLESQGVFSEAE